MNQKLLLLFSSLLIGSFISLVGFGEFGLFIFLLIWFDKVALPFVGIVFPYGRFGVEFATLPCVLVAMSLKDPSAAFIFAFLFRSLIAGLLDLIKWLFIPPGDSIWPPLIPSKDDFLRGVSSYLACVVWNLTGNFLLTLGLASAIYNCFNAFFDKIMREDQQIKPERLFNVAFNCALAFFFGRQILRLFGFA